MPLLGYGEQEKDPAQAQKGNEDQSDDSPEKQSERAQVKLWLGREKEASKKYEDDFERMRCNMDFVSSIQWKGQSKIKHDKYIVNLTLQIVNRSVASLYARNPTVEARKRKRLDFQLWDGKMETIFQAVELAQQVQLLQQHTGMMMPVPPDVMALLTDFQNGRKLQQMIEKVGKTLEIVYQYQMDNQEQDFKTQMKTLVRQVRVCGVGYIKPLFCRDYETELTSSETRLSVMDRAKMAQAILKKLQDGKITEESAEVSQLKSLLGSLNPSPLDAEKVRIKERLVFDFPESMSIIPDPNCTCLKGFRNGHWLCEEFYYPLDFVNAFYETKIEATSDLKTFDAKNKEEGVMAEGEKQDSFKRKVRVLQFWCLDDKSTFTLVDGWKDFVQKPETVDPAAKGFWCHFPVTFNDVITSAGCKATIFPPSDVDLVEPLQKEKNRVGESLRRHRKANGPRYVYPDGALDDEDLDMIANAEDQQMFGLKGLQPGQEPGKVLQALDNVPIQKELYDTSPIQEDILLATGQQEANIGPAQPNVTATGSSISEQSRQSVAGSEVDGLDDSLTAVAKYGGELLLKDMTPQTVAQIAGVGFAWPGQNKEAFLNEVELEIVAASSGRPNKVLELQNWQQLAPLIMQAAQMPPQAQPTIQAVIRETLKRLDDRIEPADFFPLPIPMMAPGQEGQPGQEQQGQQGPQQFQGPDHAASKRTPKKNKRKLSPAPGRPQEGVPIPG